MSETVRHGLPLLSAGQAQKEVTHNEALLTIDRQLHLAVESRGLESPPAAPIAGSAFIVAAGAGGAWAGQSGKIASFDGFGWHFAAPVKGCLAWVADEAAFSVYDGDWSTGGWPADGLRISGRQLMAAPPVAVAAPVGGSVIDSQCRAALVQLLAALRNQGIVLWPEIDPAKSVIPLSTVAMEQQTAAIATCTRPTH